MNNLSEKEQIEQIKHLWKQYGKPIVAGVIVALLIGFAWKYWQRREASIAENASIHYQQVLVNYDQGKITSGDVMAKALRKDYKNTAYAKFAALMLARQEIYQKNYVQAEKHLRWVMQKAKSSALRELARIRYARILLAQKKYDLALKTIQKIDDKVYMPMILTVKGDVYLAMDKKSKAHLAYQQALKLTNINDLNHPLLEMKANDLAGVNQSKEK